MNDLKFPFGSKAFDVGTRCFYVSVASFPVTHILSLQVQLNTLKLIAARLSNCVPVFYRTKRDYSFVKKVKIKIFNDFTCVRWKTFCE